eukprot:TRINITY_DN12297_c0_g1_i2.p2 TRINITY_DN12297_c0_g1~~TRINITY_DN12297_c0_g1_i2.p2  ORF type:complete len:102 (+),score=8.71 TRINITY_DN12297_c0_g1_i2:73-378(+)
MCIRDSSYDLHAREQRETLSDEDCVCGDRGLLPLDCFVLCRRMEGLAAEEQGGVVLLREATLEDLVCAQALQSPSPFKSSARKGTRRLPTTLRRCKDMSCK